VNIVVEPPTDYTRMSLAILQEYVAATRSFTQPRSPRSPRSRPVVSCPAPQRSRHGPRSPGGDSGQLNALRAKASAEYEPWKERLAHAGGALALQDEIGALASSSGYLAEYQAVVVPGYLQTPAYMREMALGDPFLADGIPIDTLDHVIAAKLRQQSILYEPGREIVHVVGEAGLRTRVGTISAAFCRRIAAEPGDAKS